MWPLRCGVIESSEEPGVILLRGHQGERRAQGTKSGSGRDDRQDQIDQRLDQRLFSISETQQAWHTTTPLQQRPGPSAHVQGTSPESSLLDIQTLARPLSYREWLILRRVQLFTREIRRCAIYLFKPYQSNLFPGPT
jgi:hypothetical protein